MKSRHMAFVVGMISVVLLAVSFSQPVSIAAKGEVASGSNGMATTAHPLASQAAIKMLQRGGNAVDAAVAAAFAIGVVEPDGSGIGGGGGMLISLAKQEEPVYINYYAQASARVNEIVYNSRADARSAKAILVPGTVAGLTTALAKYGSLPLAVVLEPAISYAEKGFPVDQTLAQIILDNVELVQKYPTTAATYLRDGFPLAEGDTLQQPELARILNEIARRGSDAFYKGPIAAALVQGVQENGGMLTIEDLANFRAIISAPVHGSYRGYEVFSAAPPQSGVSIIEALNILENEDLAKLGHFSTSAEALHVMAESIRRMYADRTAFLDDPRITHVPVVGLTSKAYAQTRYGDVNKVKVEPAEYRKTKAGDPLPFDSAEAKRTAPKGDRSGIDAGGKFNRRAGHPQMQDRAPMRGVSWTDLRSVGERQFEGGHTTHLSVMDKEGNVVTLTQTLGTFFGSGLTVEGVLLNCGMSNFSTTSSVNAIGPNRQPRSSIAPTIIMKGGKPFLSVGSPGAARIEATIVELIVNVIDFGMDAGRANQAPRFFCQKNDDYLHLESRIGENVQEELKKKGHTLRVYGDYDLFFGGAQLIMVDPKTGTMTGSADPRRGGVAMGY